MLLYNVDNGYNGLDQIKLNGIKVGGKLVLVNILYLYVKNMDFL